MLSPDFAVLAAVLPLAGFASYLRDTLRGKTQPNRVSWSLWAAAPLIAFAAEQAQRTSLKVSLLTFALGAGPALTWRPHSRALAPTGHQPGSTWRAAPSPSPR